MKPGSNDKDHTEQNAYGSGLFLSGAHKGNGAHNGKRLIQQFEDYMRANPVKSPNVITTNFSPVVANNSSQSHQFLEKIRLQNSNAPVSDDDKKFIEDILVSYQQDNTAPSPIKNYTPR